MHAVVVRPLEDGGESTGECTLKPVTQREIARLRPTALGRSTLTNVENLSRDYRLCRSFLLLHIRKIRNIEFRPLKLALRMRETRN